MIRLLARSSGRSGRSAGVRVGSAVVPAVPVCRLIGTVTTGTAQSTSTTHITDSPVPAAAAAAAAESITSDVTDIDLTPRLGTTSSSDTSISNADSSSDQLDLSQYMEQAKAEFSRRFPEPRILTDRIAIQPSYLLSAALSRHIPHECLPRHEAMVPELVVRRGNSKHPNDRYIVATQALGVDVATQLPQGHHLVYFPPTGELMPDGAEKDLCPGAPFVYRLWRGGSLKFWGSLPFDMETLRYCLEDIGPPTLSLNNPKGKETVSVDIKRRYYHGFKNIEQVLSGYQDRLPAVEETRDLLFLREPYSARPANETPVLFDRNVPDYSFELTPDHNLLFQFSALTYNAHAIHLNPEYAKNVEGHKGLLVHGPLTLLLMLSALRGVCGLEYQEAFRAHDIANQWRVRSIDYRNLRPLYAGEKIKVCVTHMPDRKGVSASTRKKWRVWIEDSEGRCAVKASASTGITASNRQLKELTWRRGELSAKMELMEKDKQLMDKETELMVRDKELVARLNELTAREKELMGKEKRLAEKKSGGSLPSESLPSKAPSAAPTRWEIQTPRASPMAKRRPMGHDVFSRVSEPRYAGSTTGYAGDAKDPGGESGVLGRQMNAPSTPPTGPSLARLPSKPKKWEARSSITGNDVGDDEFSQLEQETMPKPPPPPPPPSKTTAPPPDSNPPYGSRAAREVKSDENVTKNEDEDPFDTLMKEIMPSTTTKNTKPKKTTGPAPWEIEDQNMPSEEKANSNPHDSNLKTDGVDKLHDEKPSAMETKEGGDEEAERDWLRKVEKNLNIKRYKSRGSRGRVQ